MKTTLLTMLILSGCAALKPSKQELPLSLVEATAQNWAGGAAGSGTGTNYAFKLTVHTSEELRFDTVWVKDYALPLKLVKIAGKSGLTYGKGDTLIVTARKHKLDPRMRERIKGEDQPKIKEETPVKPPVVIEGEALLQYRFNNREQYIQVAAIKKLKPVFFP